MWDPDSPRLWDIFYAVCVVGVLILVAAMGADEPIRDKWLAAGLLAAMAIWYVVVGRRLSGCGEPTSRVLLFHGVMFGLYAGALVATGLVSFLMFGLCPMVYMTVRFRHSHYVLGAYAFAPAVLALVVGDYAAVGRAVTLGAVVMTISVVFAETTARAERVSDERRELIDQLNATRAEVTRLSHEAGVAEERQRLAGEIHDTIAQGLSSVVMLVEAATAAMDTNPAGARTHLALAARTARENMDEARAIVGALTPTPLAASSLSEALRRLGHRFEAETEVRVDVAVTGTDRPLPTAVEVVLLRAAQESLNNTRKHADATRATLSLTYQEEAVVLQLTDDGRGFDPGTTGPGYGLPTMRGRLEQVGGALDVSSVLGRGTTIRAEVYA